MIDQYTKLFKKYEYEKIERDRNRNNNITKKYILCLCINAFKKFKKKKRRYNN